MASLKSLAMVAVAGGVLIVLSLTAGSALDPLGFVGLVLVAGALLGLTQDPFGIDTVADRHRLID